MNEMNKILFNYIIIKKNVYFGRINFILLFK